MRLRISKVEPAIHPSERVVEIETRSGPVQLVLDATVAASGHIEIGAPLSQSNGHYMIELPRETFQGEWRVWVPVDSLVQSLEGAA